MTEARLLHICSGYAVIHEGKLLVMRSRDPETDAARALQAMNRQGVLHLYDGLPGGKAGKLRTITNIAKASKLRAVEADHGPRFVKYRRTGLEASSSPEQKAA
jgi:hypothetical protein